MMQFNLTFTFMVFSFLKSIYFPIFQCVISVFIACAATVPEYTPLHNSLYYLFRGSFWDKELVLGFIHSLDAGQLGEFWLSRCTSSPLPSQQKEQEKNPSVLKAHGFLQKCYIIGAVGIPFTTTLSLMC